MTCVAQGTEHPLNVRFAPTVVKRRLHGFDLEFCHNPPSVRFWILAIHQFFLSLALVKLPGLLSLLKSETSPISLLPTKSLLSQVLLLLLTSPDNYLTLILIWRSAAQNIFDGLFFKLQKKSVYGNLLSLLISKRNAPRANTTTLPSPMS